jgi:pimeloyl-ACP methyl ester carboxylesterase
MATATDTATRLAYDDEGAGTPVVFLHGLTFDRRTWRPLIERLGGSVRSVAIDLPAHGESRGAPPPVEQVPSRVHELITSLALDRPIVVGHSMSAAFAAMYASAYPTRGLVFVDNGPHVRPFAELVQRLAPALRSPGFMQVWQTFESTLGLERIPEPTRSLVLDTHEVEQDVVVAYWGMVLDTDPAELQAWIDTQILPKLEVPCLGVFGRPITDGDRERFDRLRDVQLEEWAGDGHFVHLVDPDRFATRLRRFIDHCTATG